MIEDSPEGGLNIITMLQDFFGWVRNASPPEAAHMASKGMLIEDGWAFFGVGGAGLWDGRIYRTCWVRTVSTINANAAFPFPHSPLEGSQDKTLNEVDEETRKMNVERFGFFLHKFCLDVLMIGSDCRVIIILISSRNFRSWSEEDALEGNALCLNAEC